VIEAFDYATLNAAIKDPTMPASGRLPVAWFFSRRRRAA
jgi:hypothetical protein